MEASEKQVQIIFNSEDYQLLKRASKTISLNPTAFTRSCAIVEAKRILRQLNLEVSQE